MTAAEKLQAEVVEFVDFLKSPKKYEKLGARVPRGTHKLFCDLSAHAPQSPLV